MGRKLFNLINENTNDIRRLLYIDPTSKLDASYKIILLLSKSFVALFLTDVPGKKQAPGLRIIEMVYPVI